MKKLFKKQLHILWSKAFLLTISFLFFCGLSHAQVIEDFETEIENATSFSEGGVSFNTTNGLAIDIFVGGGSSGDKFIAKSPANGAVGSIQMATANKVFRVLESYVYISTSLAGDNPNTGDVTFTGTLSGGGTVTHTFTVTNTSFSVDNGFQFCNFVGTPFNNQDLTALSVVIPNNMMYFALDDFKYIPADANSVDVGINSISLAEGDSGNTPFDFTLTRNNNSTAFAVTATSVNGTANGTDFTPINTTVNFTAGGALTQTVTVNVLGDIDPEPNENFVVNLSNPTNGATISVAQGTATVEDDDLINEDFEGEIVGGMTFSEPEAAFSLTNDLEIGFYAPGGGGGAGSDNYLDTGAGDGSSSGSVGKIQLTTANTVFQLLQVDLYPSGDDGNMTASGNVTFTGTRPDMTTVSHTFSVIPPGDFSWAENLSFSGTPLDGENLTEVEVILGAGLDYVGIDNFRYAVFDNNTTLVSIGNAVIDEGNAGTSNMTFTVSRNVNTTAFAVDVQSADITANAGSDYIALPLTTLNFSAGGPLSQTVTITINGDLSPEETETFAINLSNPTNSTQISGGQGIGTINDDDTICETYEDEAPAGTTTHTESGISFTTTNTLKTGFFAPGSGGSGGSDYYLESDITGVPYSGSAGEIQITTPNKVFNVLQLDLYTSNDADPVDQESSSVNFIGKRLDGTSTAAVTLTTGTSSGSFTENLSFAGTALENEDLIALEVVFIGTTNYLAIDDLKFAVYDSFTPEMDITDASGDAIADGADLAATNVANSTDFGDVSTSGGTASFTYTITNSGAADLDFTGSPLVELTGGEVGDFTVTSQINIDPLPHSTGNTTTFTIEFTPSAAGLRSTTVSIENDDLNENPYTFVIKGNGTVPLCSLTCPNNINVNNDAGLCTANVTYAAVGTGNCLNLTQIQGIASGSDFPVGMTTNIFEVSDGTNTEQCSFTVTVADTEAPVLTFCESDITTNTDPGSCEAIVNFSPPTAVDNCALGVQGVLATDYNSNNGQRGVMFDITAVSTLNISRFDANLYAGTIANYEIYYKEGTFQGSENNAGAWTFVGSITGITSIGNNIPTPLPIPVNVTIPEGETYGFYITNDFGGGTSYTDIGSATNSLATNADMTITGGVGKSYPFGLTFNYRGFNGTVHYGTNLSITQIEGDAAPGSSFSVGTTPVNYEISDGSGNTVNCSFDVTVTENQAPTISCPNNIVTNVDAGACTASPTWIASAEDNCGTVPSMASAGNYTFTNEGQLNGHYYFLSQEVLTSTSDSDADQMTAFNAAQSAALALGGHIVTINDITENNFVEAIASTQGNGIIIGYTDQDVEGSFTWVGGNGSGYTNWATGDPNNDGAGEDYVRIQTDGMWRDQILNIGTPKPFLVEIPNPANIPGYVGPPISGSHDSGDAFGIGTTTVNLTTTDASNNTDACSFTVTVNDNEAPQITCPSNINVNTDAGNCSAVVVYTTPVGTDNCTPTTTQTAGLASGATYPTGMTMNTFQVTDGTSTVDCSFNIVVTDNEVPQITCPSNINVNTDAGNCNAVVTYTAPIGTDNCTPMTTQTAGLASGATYPTGTTTNTFQVTDGTSTADCSFNIVVTDNEAPQIICPSNVSVNTDAGNCSAVVVYTAPVGTDNCTPTTTQTAGMVSGATYPTGMTTNTFQVTDGTSTVDCSFNIVVTDNENPMAICQNIDVQLDVNNSASLTATQIDGGSSDNCSVSISIPTTTFDCDDLGPQDVTLTATDSNNNTHTCVAVITVKDDTNPCCAAPVAACQPFTAFVTTSGIVTISASDVDNSSTADCGLQSLTIDNSTFSCSDIGTAQSVTLTITDINNESDNCVATVSIEDNIAPVAICPTTLLTVTLDASGNGTLAANALVGNSTDNCSVSGSSAAVSYTCADVGIQLVTLTVSDGTNTDTQDCNVTVEQGSAVAITNINATDESCLGTSDGTITITASGANLEYSINGTDYQTSNVFTDVAPNTYTVTVRVQNANGCIQSSSATVNAGVMCGAEIEDPCACLNNASPININMGTGGDDGSFSEVVAVTGPDGGALPAGLTFSIIAPTAGVLDAFNVPAVGSQSPGTPVAADGSVTLMFNAVNGHYELPFVHLDNIGYSITIEGPQAVGTPGNLSLTIGNKCAYPNPVFSPALDNSYCPNVSAITLGAMEPNGADAVSFTVNGNTSATFDPSTLGIGTHVVEMTYDGLADANGGNSPDGGTTAAITGCTQTVVQTIEVTDTEAPVAVCPTTAPVVMLDMNGVGVLGANALAGNNSTDNCSVIETSPLTNYTCADIGTQMVTLTASDGNPIPNTNTINCSVTIVDNMAPVAICPTTVPVVTLDADGNGTLAANALAGGNSADNCSVTETSPVTNYTCADIGTQTVTLTATDGNTTPNVTMITCSVTVEDTVNPAALCQDVTVQLDVDGNGSTTAIAVDNGSNDACGIASLTLSQTDFVCSEVGGNSVTLTVVDVNDNESTCTATVTVEDTVNPAALCQDVTVQLDVDGNGSTTAIAVDNGSNDACGIASLTLSQTDFVCSEVGGNSVTLTVVDVNDNESTCTATVTVEDNENPAALCQDVTVQLDVDGNGSTTAIAVDNGSNDACGIASLTLSQTDFVCGEVGGNSVTLTVVDVNDNESTCTATVTVEDNIAPNVLTKDIVAELDNEGNVTITTADIDDGTTDACGIADMSLDFTTFNCGNVGENTVNLTVTDVNGNTESESAIVTVVDLIPAEIECRQPVSTTITPGACERIDLTVLPPFVLYDNCGIDSGISISRTPAGNDFSIGTTVLTWTVTDSNGNDATCESLVIIEDNEAPTVTSCNTVIDFLEPNDCSAQVTVNVEAIDNCDIASIEGAGTFNLEFGIHPRTITVTDVNGNVTLHEVTIYVHDVQAPEVVSCPEDIEIVANQGENTVDLPEPIFTDNCSIYGVTNDAPEIFSVGTTSVTFTGTDTYGNTTDCSYDVTITPSIFFTGTASPIEASTEEEDESSMVTWNRPEAITHCEACLVTDMPEFIFLGEFEGHQYFLYPDATDWTEAVVLSEEINGQLVTVNDARENAFIQEQLPVSEDREVQYWTGLSDEAGEFAWLNGDAFDFINFEYDAVIHVDSINAAVMNTNGTWAMTTSGMQNGFIAERPCLDITQVAPIIETEGVNGEIIETLLTPDADWGAGEYTVIYEATDMCDSTARFSFGVTVQEPTAVYCQTSGLGQEVWLEGVVFNDYSNESENNTGYADYTEEAVELLGENPVSIQLIPGGIDLEENEIPLYWRIFADWNNDGDFFDAGEILHEQTSINVVNVDFPAMLNEEDLSVRLRIAVAKGGYPEACADYTTGEAEDYALFFPAIEVEEEEGNGLLSIYPNPANSYVMLDLTGFAAAGAFVSISDNLGKICYKQNIDAVKQKNLRIDLGDFDNGIYFVNITTVKGEVITERLVVTKVYSSNINK